ncbi:MAG: hypothetical protein BLM47_03465 [Candidatus Reconcilbacillus cellulovorans]|uniref:Uncharacterized protein n=1 Tax=Candidatus Reconcilbacillus cellulovorans TaxID=1906605 RepID=A0A2A6E2K0_9BACL|nr:MAG: hypothetical protein BLM47_03465 [Candidatus Reconcilbacillus cellulovorans]
MADFKAVDLQMALPRLPDAAIQQQQQSQKVSIDQQWLAGQNIRQAELEKQQTVRPEQPAKAAVRERQGQGGGARKNRDGFADGRYTGQRAADEAPHPYKGKFIDRRL